MAHVHVEVAPSIKRYDWGRESSVSTAKPFVPGGGKVAELWWGSHPSGPTTPPVHDIPYLLKLLTIQKPLSLQAHPSRPLARILHARDPVTYPDASDKPEMLVALTRVEALCGLRPPELISAALEDAGIPPMTQMEDVLRWSPKRREYVYAKLDKEWYPEVEMRMFKRLRRHYGNDPGVLLGAFFLNKVVLAPGEALVIRPGEVHAYVSGDGVEFMAPSDNVVRLGLTTKKVDAEQFFQVACLTPSPPRVIRGEVLVPLCTVYRHPDIRGNELGVCVIEPGETLVRAHRGRGFVVVVAGAGTMNETVDLVAGKSFVFTGKQCRLKADDNVRLHVVFTQETSPDPVEEWAVRLVRTMQTNNTLT